MILVTLSDQNITLFLLKKMKSIMRTFSFYDTINLEICGIPDLKCSLVLQDTMVVVEQKTIKISNQKLRTLECVCGIE